MRRQITYVVPVAIVIGTFLGLTAFVKAQQTSLKLKFEDVMTPKELSESGVAALTGSQREVLDGWLNRYTQAVIKMMVNQEKDGSTPPPKTTERSDCSPAVESTIAGDFNGWDGETIFKLDNGQIWEQAEYDYTYSYSYRPDVTIYQTTSGCRMKVEDEDETITVRRIK